MFSDMKTFRQSKFITFNSIEIFWTCSTFVLFVSPECEGPDSISVRLPIYSEYTV